MRITLARVSNQKLLGQTGKRVHWTDMRACRCCGRDGLHRLRDGAPMGRSQRTQRVSPQWQRLSGPVRCSLRRSVCTWAATVPTCTRIYTSLQPSAIDKVHASPACPSGVSIMQLI